MIIGIGTDIIEIERIKSAILAGEGKFKARVFTPGEIAYCDSQKDPYPSFAARFAAKEAVLKALGCGFSKVTWQDVEVEKARLEGRPKVLLKGKTAEIASTLGVRYLHISLSHSRKQALAYVIAES